MPESFVDPLTKGMQKIRSGWLRDFLKRDEIESEYENPLTTDEINFELHNYFIAIVMFTKFN